MFWKKRTASLKPTGISRAGHYSIPGYDTDTCLSQIDLIKSFQARRMIVILMVRVIIFNFDIFHKNGGKHYCVTSMYPLHKTTKQKLMNFITFQQLYVGEQWISMLVTWPETHEICSFQPRWGHQELVFDKHAICCSLIAMLLWYSDDT